MSAADIEGLVTFGLQIFAQVFSLFKHPTTPAPVATAPAIISTLSATPGVTDAHKTVIVNAVNSAAAAASQTPSPTQ
jgi:hypothetical protein